MKFRNLAACIIATTLGVTSLAFAAPRGQTVVIKYKTALSVVNASAYVDDVQYTLTAKSYDDMDGVLQGQIYVERFDYNNFSYSAIYCFGAAYANAVTVNKSSGASSVNVVLDPASSDCFSVNTTTLNVAITGVPTGLFGRSDSGTTTFQYAGSMEKASFQSDGFDENFTGTIGYYTGPLSGNAETAKLTNRTRVK